MELLILEIIWWAVLFFFFWALRDARGRLQADLEAMALVNDDRSGRPRLARFQRPQNMRHAIGSYQGQTIYRFVDVDGRTYEFDRACPPECAASVEPDEVYLAPGLVYREAAGAPVRTDRLPQMPRH
ncbi:MAG TPA: hypothetical protein VM406_10335 [Noviherbaspirillum sp.]|nr:hypothetical protein [Noviherbaspirillum sp.]